MSDNLPGYLEPKINYRATCRDPQQAGPTTNKQSGIVAIIKGADGAPGYALCKTLWDGKAPDTGYIKIEDYEWTPATQNPEDDQNDLRTENEILRAAIVATGESDKDDEDLPPGMTYDYKGDYKCKAYCKVAIVGVPTQDGRYTVDKPVHAADCPLKAALDLVGKKTK